MLTRHMAIPMEGRRSRLPIPVSYVFILFWGSSAESVGTSNRPTECNLFACNVLYAQCP